MASKSFFTNQDIGQASLKTVGVSSIFFRDYRYTDLHGHEFTEVNIVLRGKGSHFLDRKCFQVKRGDIFIIPPHVQHAYKGRDLDIFHLLIGGPFLARHSSRLFLIPGFLPLFSLEPYFRTENDFRYGLNLDGKEWKKVVGLMNEIDADLKVGGWGREIGGEALVLYLISVLCAAYVRKMIRGESNRAAPSRTQSFQRVIRHIEQNFAEKLTLGALARVAGMSSNHLGRLFQGVFGLTPMDFLQQHRLRVAQMLLLNHEKKIANVALETGFYDSAHFSRCFSKHVGISPRHYRRTTRRL